MELFVVLMALTIWIYFDERKDTWLIAAAALLALAYTAMETTLIFVAIFAIFLCAHFAFEFLRPRVNWNNGTLTLVTAVFGIPGFGIVVALNLLRALFRRQSDESLREIPSFNLGMVFGSFSLPLLTPALFYALNIICKRFTNADCFFSIAAFTDVNAINSIAQNQPDMVARFLARREIVDGSSDKLLARAALSRDQHRQMGIYSAARCAS